MLKFVSKEISSKQNKTGRKLNARELSSKNAKQSKLRRLSNNVVKNKPNLLDK